MASRELVYGVGGIGYSSYRKTYIDKTSGFHAMQVGCASKSSRVSPEAPKQPTIQKHGSTSTQVAGCCGPI